MKHNKLFDEIEDQFGTLTGIVGAEQTEVLIEVFHDLYIENQCRGDRLWHRLSDDHYETLRMITAADRKTLTERLIKYVSDCNQNGGKGPQGPQVRTNTFDENDFFFLDRLTPKTEHLKNYEELSAITGIYGALSFCGKKMCYEPLYRKKHAFIYMTEIKRTLRK